MHVTLPLWEITVLWLPIAEQDCCTTLSCNQRASRQSRPAYLHSLFQFVLHPFNPVPSPLRALLARRGIFGLAPISSTLLQSLCGPLSLTKGERTPRLPLQHLSLTPLSLAVTCTIPLHCFECILHSEAYLPQSGTLPAPKRPIHYISPVWLWSRLPIFLVPITVSTTTQSTARLTSPPSQKSLT